MSANSDDLPFPDAAILLAATVHTFGVPRMPETRHSSALSYVKSFNLASNTKPKTRQVLINADAYRSNLMEVLKSKSVSYARVVQECQRYAPVVYQILLSCKLQPDQAQLDQPLVFEWQSGIEQNPRLGSSQTLMYEVVMSVACEGLSRAGAAAESSAMNEYSGASQSFAKAAGIFNYLSTSLLPKWTDKGTNVTQDMLPSECNVSMATALEKLFLINGQQMAVATLLAKPGNATSDSLLSKLCFGTHQQLDAFLLHMRQHCKLAMDRMDKNFFSLVTVQSSFYKSLAYYFQARGLWAKHEYGVAIAVLNDSINELKPRTPLSSTGIPDLSKNPALAAVSNNVKEFRAHQEQLLSLWKQDNSSIYFERVPAQVPAEVKLQEGENMLKSEPYVLDVTGPIQFKLTVDKDTILQHLTRSSNRNSL